MLMFYFSGTGNSKWLAQRFCEKASGQCFSIEEPLDFKRLIAKEDTIGFCYPIYGGCVPRLMREFVTQHLEALQDKKLIIFCTQLVFSGDGARAFTDLLPANCGEIIYAEHFNMPNNICNFDLFPIKNGEAIEGKLKAADKKLDRVVKHLYEGKVTKRGFNWFSNFIGKSQSAFWPDVEEKNKGSIKVDHDCISCGICVKLCPMNNLSLHEKSVKHDDNCMICYRCVNACPKQSITVLLHKKPKVQYKGIPEQK